MIASWGFDVQPMNRRMFTWRVFLWEIQILNYAVEVRAWLNFGISVSTPSVASSGIYHRNKSQLNCMRHLCDWVKGRSISVANTYIYIYAKISGFMVSALVTVTTVTEKKFGYGFSSNWDFGFSSKLGPWFGLQLRLWLQCNCNPQQDTHRLWTDLIYCRFQRCSHHKMSSQLGSILQTTCGVSNTVYFLLQW